MADRPYQDRPPNDDDIRHDELEFDPSIEPQSAKAWLNLLDESEQAFERWNNHCDLIDRMYASIDRLAQDGREKQFQMLWSNAEVIRPSIYARAPTPVVVPKFKDRRPVYQAASEVMERSVTVAFDIAHMDELMKQIRDDLVMIGRGVAWCRYEGGKNGTYYDHEKVCIDFKHRRDFLHSVSRCWYEVTWVAGASYLTRAEARKRFYRHSGDAYQQAEYKVDKESKQIGGADDRERAKFWEIWHKTEKRVVWVAQGCEDILDEDDPHLDLQDFFPCPCPVYGTLQRGSLVPVPDSLQYKDQLDEVNMLTSRIHALSDALEVRGFYPAGGAEIADAVEAAVKLKTPGRVLVPISNWAAFGGSKEVIIWLPIKDIADAIVALVSLRKQIIDDIYQITGLSDLMRGATDARETLGAQELKSQFGSSRIKDKQNEIKRLARELVVISSEIITEKFNPDTIVMMSQTQLPQKHDQQREVFRLQQEIAMLTQQVQQASQSPQGQQMLQKNPDQANQMLQQAQQQIQQKQSELQKISEQPNLDQVLTFLKDNRAKCFVLDIETDSTIMIDEKSEKESRSEFVGGLTQLLPQLAQMMAAAPESADFCSSVLKFAVAPFRAGRELDGAIDELAELMKAKADQPKGDDPTTATNKTAIQIEQIKQQTEKQKNDAMNALKAQELQMKDMHEKMKIQSAEKMKLADIMAKQRDDEAKSQQTNLKAMQDREKHQADMIGKQTDMQMNAQKLAMARQAAEAKQADMAVRQSERQAAQQIKQQQAVQRPPL
jgi:hypothetical protein